MDDGVTEIRELVSSDEKPAEKKQRVEEESGEPHSNGGVINNLISSLMSNDKDAENGDETKEKDDKEGGMLNNLISSLVSPRSKAADDTFTSVDQEKMVDEEKSGSGGIFNNLISGILHRDDEAGADGGKEKLPTDEGGGSGGGGGFIDNLVSQLPSPLSDDAVPATDEASILIHSIVHD